MGYTVSERMRQETRVVNDRPRLGLPNSHKPHSMVSIFASVSANSLIPEKSNQTFHLDRFIFGLWATQVLL